MYETIKTRIQDGALIITLARPEARNAMSVLAAEELGKAIDELEENPELRCGIITNEGPVFCSGSDLKEISAGTYHMPKQKDGTDAGFAGITKRYVSKPLIAAVEGKALGGGLEIVFAVDLCVASDDAMFGFPEPRVGLTAAGGGSLLRAGQMIPTKFANQLLLLAEPIDAPTALQWGIINQIVPAGKTVDAALEMAAKIALGAPLAIECSKRTVYETMGSSPLYPNEGWEALERIEKVTVESEDAHEGSTAFVEKRKPVWKGR